MLTLRLVLPVGPAQVHHFDSDVLVVGRGDECDLAIPDPALSRVHLELRREGAAWTLTDRDSANGTFLNGLRVTGTLPLNPGDQVRLGDTMLTLEAEPTSADSASSSGATTIRRPLEEQGSEGRAVLLGSSDLMTALRRDIEKVAPRDLTVLVLGETGTGKELIAQALHLRSNRHAGPFVAVNCPALPESLLEAELFGIEEGVATGVVPREGLLAAADGGTVFLDEIGDLEMGAQAKLLRFLETKTIEAVGSRKPVTLDVRIVAATHQNLDVAVEDGRFRRDLHHRLNGVTLTAPRLADHREDIPEIVQHFIDLAAGPAVDIEDDVLDVLADQEWPGNVRQLRQAIERAVAFCEGQRINVSDLPENLRGGSAASSATGALYSRLVKEGASFWELVRDPFLKRELSKQDAQALIARAYRESDDSYSKAARKLGLVGEEKRFLNFVNRHDLGVK